MRIVPHAHTVWEFWQCIQELPVQRRVVRCACLLQRQRKDRRIAFIVQRAQAVAPFAECAVLYAAWQGNFSEYRFHARTFVIALACAFHTVAAGRKSVRASKAEFCHAILSGFVMRRGQTSKLAPSSFQFWRQGEMRCVFDEMIRIQGMTVRGCATLPGRAIFLLHTGALWSARALGEFANIVQKRGQHKKLVFFVHTLCLHR